MAGLDSALCGAIGVLAPGLILLGCASSGSGSGRPDTPADLSPPAATEPAAEPVSPPVEEESTESTVVESMPPLEVIPDVTPESLPQEETDEEPDDETIVVIDTGTKDLTQKPVSLVEAAEAERARRNSAPPSEIVITDKNLAEYATGELTMAEPADPDAVERSAELSALEKERAEQEAYWRQGALEIRQAWRDAYDRVEELEGKVFELRQDFYREDDGFYRDSEIKPAWDRAIEELEQARAEVEAKQQELVEFTNLGREAGALPGWLREGIELEPPPPETPPDPAEPSEPVIYEPEASDPP